MSSLDLDELLAFLESPDAELRWRAAEALGKAGDKRAEMPLIGVLTDENHEVRLAAAGALARVGGYLAVPQLMMALDDEDEWVAWQAASALGRIGDRRAVGPLIHLFDGDSSSLRKKAAQALTKILGGEVDEDLPVSSLEQADAALAQIWLDRSQGEVLRDEAIPVLCGAVAEASDLQMRCWAARVLGDMQRMEAFDPLVEVLEEANPVLRAAAVEALEKITGQSPGSRAEDWRKWREGS